jgi:hypothetical protein
MTSSFTVPLPTGRQALIATGAVAALLVMVVGAPSFGPRPTLAADTPAAPEHTISVGGTGRITLVPDIADLRLGVSITKPTVAQARDAAASAMTSVVAALKAAGIAAKDIQTATLSLQPVYDYNSRTNPPRLTGYQLTNTVAVTVRNLDRLAEAIDSSLKAGATTMDGVTFRVADQTAAERQARAAAVADARAKADGLASAASVAIVGVSSIAETSNSIPQPIPFAGAAPAADKVATPVEAGTLDVIVAVSVVYLIR